MKEIIFLVEEKDEGGYIARAVGASIFTEADTLTELYDQIRDAVRCHFVEEEQPHPIRVDPRPSHARSSVTRER